MLGGRVPRPVRTPRKTREGRHHLRGAGPLRYRFICPRRESLGEILAGGKHGHRCSGASRLDLPHDRSPVPIGQYQVDHCQIELKVPGDEPQGPGDRGGVGEHREIGGFLWLARRGPEGAAEHNRQHLREEDVIVDDQDVQHGSLPFAVRWQCNQTAMNRR
jgi:hypothetical protein